MYSGLNNVLNSVPKNLSSDLSNWYLEKVPHKHTSNAAQIWVRPVTVLSLAPGIVIRVAEITGRVALGALLLIPFLVALTSKGPDANEFTKNFVNHFVTSNLLNGLNLLATPVNIFNTIFCGNYPKPASPKPSEEEEAAAASSGAPTPPAESHVQTAAEFRASTPLPLPLPDSRDPTAAQNSGNLSDQPRTPATAAALSPLPPSPRGIESNLRADLLSPQQADLASTNPSATNSVADGSLTSVLEEAAAPALVPVEPQASIANLDVVN